MRKLSRSTWCILVVSCSDRCCLLVIVTLQTEAHQWGMSSGTGNRDKVFLAHVHTLHEHPKAAHLRASPVPCFSGHEKTLFDKQEVEMVEEMQNTLRNPLLVHSAKMPVPQLPSFDFPQIFVLLCGL